MPPVIPPDLEVVTGAPPPVAAPVAETPVAGMVTPVVLPESPILPESPFPPFAVPSLAPAGRAAASETAGSERPAPAADIAALVVNRPLAPLTIAAGRGSEFRVPGDTFAAADPRATIQLTATAADGRALPEWIEFDPLTGTFRLRPPPGVRGEIALRLVARDGRGHEAVTLLKLIVRPGADSHRQGAGLDRESGAMPGEAPAIAIAPADAAAEHPGFTRQLADAGRLGQLQRQSALIEAARAAQRHRGNA